MKTKILIYQILVHKTQETPTLGYAHIYRPILTLTAHNAIERDST